MAESRTFRTSEVAERAGVTLDQLRWWDESGLVTPTGRARRENGRLTLREYTFTEAVMAALLGDLRRRGVSLFKLRRLVHSGYSDELASKSFLVVNGKIAAFADTADEAIKAAVNLRKAIMLVSLNDLRQRFTSNT